MIVNLFCTDAITFEGEKKDFTIYEGDIIECDFTDHGVRLHYKKKWYSYYNVSDLEKNFIIYQ